MFIRSENEIISLMPTARWSRPDQLYGYLEEEERVTLEPLLGTTLYQHLCDEYERLHQEYGDITSTTIKPTGKAKKNPKLPHADVTDRMDRVQAGLVQPTTTARSKEEKDVPKMDQATVRLLRICQQIEFYKMLSHKAGMLTVSFNEGGGMNQVSADGYEPADQKKIEHVVKDAFMSAGRAIDSLLLFLEADAKGEKVFTEKWQEADAFYLHKDLLFQTARVFNEYLDIKGERMAYVQLVRDIRFCQNTYLKPRVGGKLLKAVIDYSNDNPAKEPSDTLNELLDYLRTALAFYVESRRTTLGPKDDKLSRRDSMTDAQQAMAMACQYIEDNLDALGDAAADTPIYNAVRAREEQEAKDAANAEAAAERQRKTVCEQNKRKLFTGFPATHRTPEIK
jgi:chromatin segregation and condensation protein Rec8/ScpA/Scc1 (kleisin family)